VRTIDKIRKNALKLLVESGSDILFVAESPDIELGKGACFLFGQGDCITCARRLMNELKHRYKKLGIEFDYHLAKMEDKE